MNSQTPEKSPAEKTLDDIRRIFPKAEWPNSEAAICIWPNDIETLSATEAERVAGNKVDMIKIYKNNGGIPPKDELRFDEKFMWFIPPGLPALLRLRIADQFVQAGAFTPDSASGFLAFLNHGFLDIAKTEPEAAVRALKRWASLHIFSADFSPSPLAAWNKGLGALAEAMIESGLGWSDGLEPFSIASGTGGCSPGDPLAGLLAMEIELRDDDSKKGTPSFDKTKTSFWSKAAELPAEALISPLTPSTWRSNAYAVAACAFKKNTDRDSSLKNFFRELNDFGVDANLGSRLPISLFYRHIDGLDDFKKWCGLLSEIGFDFKAHSAEVFDALHVLGFASLDALDAQGVVQALGASLAEPGVDLKRGAEWAAARGFEPILSSMIEAMPAGKPRLASLAQIALQSGDGEPTFRMLLDYSKTQGASAKPQAKKLSEKELDALALLAARVHDSQALRLLCDAGADMGAKDSKGGNLIVNALMKLGESQTRAIETLLDLGADDSCLDANSRTPLQAACHSRSAQPASLAILARRRPQDIAGPTDAAHACAKKLNKGGEGRLAALELAELAMLREAPRKPKPHSSL